MGVPTERGRLRESQAGPSFPSLLQSPASMDGGVCRPEPSNLPVREQDTFGRANQRSPLACLGAESISQQKLGIAAAVNSGQQKNILRCLRAHRGEKALTWHLNLVGCNSSVRVFQDSE